MFQVEQFRVGMNVEIEHRKVNPLTNVTNDAPVLTGKIASANYQSPRLIHKTARTRETSRKTSNSNWYCIYITGDNR